MNEIEKAIKYFESLQKRYITQHNGVQCELVKTALEALYEKQEREQTENKPLTLEELIEIDGEPVVHAYFKDVKIRPEYPWYYTGYCSRCNKFQNTEVNYCCNCGAKIDGEMNNND